MAGERVRRPEEEAPRVEPAHPQMAPQREAPRELQAIPVRQEVRDRVRASTRSRELMRMYSGAFEQLAQPILQRGDAETQRRLKDSALMKYLG